MRGRFILISAPAKINLYLGVHKQKDERGYHCVDSIMTAVDLADVVAIAPADELTVRTVPEADFPMQDNTAYRAAVAMGEAFGREPNFTILIDKNIPVRAGLGGPSTDAAAVILGLCHYWNLNSADPKIDAVARSIGADVPFFLYGPPALLDGAGDTMREMFRPLTGTPVALVKPTDGGVSARAAYQRFDEDPQDPAPLDELVDALREHDETRIFANVSNNLAPAACSLDPGIDEVLSWIREQPEVRAADVSGSGSCVFAVCTTQMAAEAICHAASERGWWSHAAKMEKSGPYVAAG